MSEVIITINGVDHKPEKYMRETHLLEPGASWSATLESTSGSLWHDVTIKEDGTTVLTGYLLSMTPTRGKIRVTGMDTWARVNSTWVDEDVETSSEYTLGYYIDYLMGLTGVDYRYYPEYGANGVQPNIKIGPMSVADALAAVLKHAGLYTWVEPDGVVHFNLVSDEPTYTAPHGYIEREKVVDDQCTRHTIKVYGLGTISAESTGSLLGDPVERIGVFYAPLLETVEQAQALADAALGLYNEHGDIRTLRLAGFYPQYKIPIMVTEEGENFTITDIASELSPTEGAITTIILNFRWPGIIGGEGPTGGTVVLKGNVILCNRVNLARTSNFTSGSPNWTSIAPSGVPIMRRVRLAGPHGGGVKLWLSTSGSGLYRTESAYATPVVWDHVLTPADYNSATGLSLSAVVDVQAPESNEDIAYALCRSTTGVIHIARTLDAGESWSFTQPYGDVNNSNVIGFKVSQDNPNKVWIGNSSGSLYYCSDGLTGMSFSMIYYLPFGGVIRQIETTAQDSVLLMSTLRTIGELQGFYDVVEDAYVDSANAGTNYGSATVLECSYDNGTGRERKVLLKFNINDELKVPLSQREKNNLSWVLAVRAVAAVYSSVWVDGVTGEWTSGSVTWNNMPGEADTPNIGALQNDDWSPLSLASPNDLFDYIEGNGVWLQCREDDVTKDHAIRSMEYPTAGDYAAYIYTASGVSSSEMLLLKSTDGGSTFRDVTPSDYGAPWDNDTLVSNRARNRIHAFCKNGSDYTKWFTSDDFGDTWTERADFSSVQPADEDGQFAAAPSVLDDELVVLQYRGAPSGSPDYMILHNTEMPADLLDKSGDWESAINSLWVALQGDYGSVVLPW